MQFTESIRASLLSRKVPVIVTGASGWLGQAALEMLEHVYGAELSAYVTVFSNLGKPIILRSGRVIGAKPFAELKHLKTAPSLILHCAFLTREYAQSRKLDEYIVANREIQCVVCAAIERNGALGIFIPSSGAVYGPGRVLADDLAINPYGVLKLEDESVFQSLASRMGFPSIVLRVFNLSGPFINKFSSYALASIVEDIKNCGPIRLRADKPVWRSYVDVGDALNVAVSQLCSGRSILPFDTAGDENIEIGALGRRVADRLGVPDMPIIRPAMGTQPDDFYLGEGQKFFECAEKIGIKIKTLDEQIEITAAYMNSLAAV